MSAPPSIRSIPHGDVCECGQLAAALGCDPATITFDFCYRVLQHHWTLRCRHGGGQEVSHPSIAQQWRDMGPTDAVKAILIRNAPAEE